MGFLATSCRFGVLQWNRHLKDSLWDGWVHPPRVMAYLCISTFERCAVLKQYCRLIVGTRPTTILAWKPSTRYDGILLMALAKCWLILVARGQGDIKLAHISWLFSFCVALLDSWNSFSRDAISEGTPFLTADYLSKISCVDRMGLQRCPLISGVSAISWRSYGSTHDVSD